MLRRHEISFWVGVRGLLNAASEPQTLPNRCGWSKTCRNWNGGNFRTKLAWWWHWMWKPTQKRTWWATTIPSWYNCKPMPQKPTNCMGSTANLRPNCISHRQGRFQARNSHRILPLAISIRWKPKPKQTLWWFDLVFQGWIFWPIGWRLGTSTSPIVRQPHVLLTLRKNLCWVESRDSWFKNENLACKILNGN